MKRFIAVLLVFLVPGIALALTTRTIVNPAANSSLSSSVIRNELQILENEITTDVFPPASGGTGISTVPTFGQMLVGNVDGTYTLTATSSLGIPPAAWQILNSALVPTTTLGIIVSASSTIGDGTQAGGLTISGGSTTTKIAYFANNVGIGTSTPILFNGSSSRLLEISGVNNPGIALDNTNNSKGNQTLLFLGSTGTFAIFDTAANASRFTIDSTGQVAISSPSTNTSTQYVGLNISGAQSTPNSSTYLGANIAPTYTDVTGGTLTTMQGLQLNPRNLATSSTITTLNGLVSIPQNVNGGTVTNLRGLISTPTNIIGNVTSQYGVYSNPTVNGTSITTNMYGGYFSPEPNGSGTVTANYGVFSDPFSTGIATGLTTNQYGVYVRGGNNSSAFATTTNYFQLFLATPIKVGSITNTFGIYQQDPLLANYFAGSIGIGTTTSDTALDVYSSAAASTNGQNVLKLQAQASAANIGSGPRLVFTSTGTAAGTETADIRGYTFGNSLTGLSFGTGFGAVTPRMYINNAGNVGVGTSTPLDTFDVVGNISLTNSTSRQISLRGGDSASALAFDFPETTSASINQIRFFRSTADAATSAFQIYKGDNTATINTNLSSNSTSYINALGGSLGVGTTSPSQVFSVQGGGLFSGNIWAANITATGTLSVTGLSTLTYASTTAITASYASSTLLAIGTDPRGIASTSISTPTGNMFLEHSVPIITSTTTLGQLGAFGASGTTTIMIGNYLHSSTLYSYYCKSDVGTFYVGFGNGSATTTETQCTSAGTTVNVSANNTWAGRQNVYVDFGHSGGSVYNINVSADVVDSN